METEDIKEIDELKIKKIRQKLSLLSVSLGTDIINIIGDFPDSVEYSLLGATGVSLLGYLGLESKDKYDNYKDKKEILNLYKEFIKNYNKLNEEFELTDPVEILTMYNYLLGKGYLSNNKRFVLTGGYPCRYNKKFMGEIILTGEGDRFHPAIMLADILNDSNIEAGTLVTFKEWHSLLDSMIDDQKYEEDISIKREKDMLEDMEKRIRLSATDAITYAYKDGKSYYLDPVSNKTYRKKDGILINSIDIADPKYLKSISYNSTDNYINMMERIRENHPLTSVSEEYQKREETLNLCESNKDIFENFYQDNEDLIKETSNKILTLKTKRNIK